MMCLWTGAHHHPPHTFLGLLSRSIYNMLGNFWCCSLLTLQHRSVLGRGREGKGRARAQLICNALHPLGPITSAHHHILSACPSNISTYQNLILILFMLCLAHSLPPSPSLPHLIKTYCTLLSLSKI